MASPLLAGGRDRPPAAWLPLATLAVLLAIALGFFVHRYFVLHDHPLFWDLRVYLGAIKAHALGLGPYHPGILEMLGVDGDLKYTSTPLVDRIFDLASRFPVVLTWAEPVYIVVHVCSVVTIVSVLTTLFLGHGWREALLGLAVFLLMFATGGMNALAAANDGTLLYGLILLAVHRGFLKRRWAAFHLIVTFAVAVKPIYAPLWLLPIFADRVSAKQIGFAICGGFVAVCSYLVYVVLEPTIVQDWLANLQTQAVQTASDLGDNVFAAVHGTAGGRLDVVLPLIAQFTFDVALVSILWLGGFAGRARWAALIVLAIFVNPRLMPYDSAIASIPLVALFADSVPIPGTRLTRALVVSCPLILASIVLPYRSVGVVPAAVLQPALAFAGLVLAAWRPAWRPRSPARGTVEDGLDDLRMSGQI